MLLTLALGTGVARADTLPVVSGEAAAEVGITSARLSGEVDAGWASGDGPTTWRLQYRPVGTEEWLFGGGGTIEEAGSIPVEAIVFGASSETYEYRLQAENAAGTVETASPLPTFTTDPATAPALTTEPVTGVKYTTATLHGTVDPEGGNVNEIGEEILYLRWELQYSPKGEGNWQTADGNYIEGEAAKGTDPIPVSAQATGLVPGTEYETRLFVHYLSFAANTEAAGPDFTTDPVADPIVVIDPVTSFDATTAEFSGSIDPNAPGAAPQDPAFDVKWSFVCVPECPIGPEGGTVLADDEPEAVNDAANHLQPNTEYTVTLKATNAGGTTEASTTFQTAGLPPTVEAFEAGPIQHNQAGINGQINPRNSPTTYYFEWGSGDCSSNPCTAFPASKDASAGGGSLNRYVFRELVGLSPQTTYHFRLVAENEFGVTEGPDRSFATVVAPEPCSNSEALGAAHLPDCRAWEMVSPPDKNGNDVMPLSDKTWPADDGSAVSFASLGAFANAKGTAVDVQYIAARTAAPGTSGWATHAITPRQGSLSAEAVSNVIGPSFSFFTPDLQSALYKGWRPLTDEPNMEDYQKLYRLDGLRSQSGSPARMLSPSVVLLPFNEFLGREKVNVADTSEDLSHVLFQHRFNLTDDAQALPFTPKVYESVDGEVRLAGRIPPAGETECEEGSASPCEPASSSQAGLGTGFYQFDMISDDGSRSFFQAPSGLSGGKVYIREDGVRTVQLNVSERATPEEPLEDAQIWTASADGARTFFTTAESLVDEDQDHLPDLYMYSVMADQQGHHLTLISRSSDMGNEVKTVVGSSENGSYVYFTAVGSLTEGENAGQFTLYAWHEGTLRLIGSLPTETDNVLNGLKSGLFNNEQKASRVSPDGRHLLFTSTSTVGLAGRGGFGGQEDADNCTIRVSTGSGCRELFHYDAASGRLECMSCNPWGKTISGDAVVQYRGAGLQGTAAQLITLNNALSSSGRRSFFTTTERLVPADTNGPCPGFGAIASESCADAYEFDARTGNVRLLSSGESSSASFFLEATPDGSTAFIATREPLSAWDLDSSYDIYAARTGGGVPEPVPPPPGCQGDACQPPPLQLSDATPASSGFTGQGNVKQGGKPPRRCGKKAGKAAAKKRRCVKKGAKPQNRGNSQNRRAGL